MLLLVVASLTGSLHLLAMLPDATWWHVLGGIASAWYVVAAILLSPRLGAGVSVGLFLAGQIVALFILDTFGLLDLPKTPIQAQSAIGALAVLVGAVTIVIGQDSIPAKAQPVRGLPWIALALIAGAALPVQGATNALLLIEVQAPFAVALTSFVVAMLSMAASYC